MCSTASSSFCQPVAYATQKTVCAKDLDLYKKYNDLILYLSIFIMYIFLPFTVNEVYHKVYQGRNSRTDG